eukprot:2125566-Pleurochrysis_carterae.AAC.1
MSTAQHQLDALDLAFSSASMIVTRFLVSNSADLRGRNPVFTKLGLCMPELLTYFTNCQAFDPRTNEIHENAHRYRWDHAAMKLVFKGKFSEVDWINAPSG